MDDKGEVLRHMVYLLLCDNDGPVLISRLQQQIYSPKISLPGTDRGNSFTIICFSYAQFLQPTFAYLSLPTLSFLKSTGVEVSDEVTTSFNKFKLGQEPYKLRYFIYEIKDKKTIVIEKQGAREKTYNDFVEELPENDCRYGLIDIEFETDDGRPTSKIVFISWNPDTASVRPKMLYSGSKEALKSALVGVGIHINATDHSELDFEESILPVVKKFT